ncbi:MAG TPA: hypothetical protein VFC00_22010 [Micromonosporaceae bacterium]|nr:hypothetical protein [Micromonosporaceae bacterium]
MKVACPYCYRRIEGDRLWFRCRGRPATRRAPCPLEVDKIRLEETGFAQPTYPAFPPPGSRRLPTLVACPKCGGETGFRVCPNCHSPLPEDFGTMPSPLIAMVGAVGTGKTVYLTVLAHELRGRLRRRFDADVRLVGDAQGGPEGPTWLRSQVSTLYDQHELSPKTTQVENNRREPLVFKWRREQGARLPLRPRTVTSYLSFYDTSGDDLLTVEDVTRLNYLDAADALILLLDPFTLPHTRDQIHLPPSAITSAEAAGDVVDRVTQVLHATRGTGGSAIKVPVAVVFAKLDAFFDLLGLTHPLVDVPEPVPYHDEADSLRTHEHVKSLLHDLDTNDDIDRHLRLNYQTFRYFGVSALGAQPDYETGAIHEGGVRPHRVEEPLVWLFSRFGVVPQRERR